MNLEKLHRVKSLFVQALEIDSDKREEFLSEQCKDDDEIRNEVLSLLNVYDKASNFLEIPPPLIKSKEDTKGIKNSFIGKHIGNYLIEDEAGVGGMGIVYKGKRADKEFEQTVAIKILKHSFNSEYAVRCFHNERQALANLQHPNIARLLDGGTTDDGLPYFVMEYIDGTLLIEYCDRENMNIRQRLEIFRLICSAVQYAHQNLIIHRDIKPGNVLVNKQGRPKLLDFGIAKLLDDELAETNKGLTKTGVWHLTPEYASPEQIKGEPVTTASDIYSLGVMLYQLLSGHKPYRITSSSHVAISRIITEEHILKPSVKFKETEEFTTPDGNTKEITPDNISATRGEKPDKIYDHLTGDIDNIILKAMHKDPSRRYASVEQFSEDIRKHLVGLPVIARKDTVKYRISKFVQRHKIGVSLSVLFITLLVASIVLISWEANLVSEQRDKALIEAKKFERVNMFLQGMLSSVDPNELGRDVKVYDILEKAAKDIETELTDQPEIEADIRRTLGLTYMNLGEYDKAVPFLEKSIGLKKEIYGATSKETAIGLHDLGLYYHWIGDYKLADSLYGQSLMMYRKVLDKPIMPLAEELNDYAILLTDLGDYDKSEKYLREALSISEKISGGKNRYVASMMNNLALTIHYKHNLEEAEKYYLKSQKLFIGLFGENHPEVASTYNNLAFIYIDKGDLDKAEQYFLKSYQLKLKLKGPDHPDVGLALNNLGGVKFKEGNFSEAESYFKKAIKQYKKSLPMDHVRYAISYFWLGKTLMEENNFVRAEVYLRRSLKIREKQLGENYPLIVTTKSELGKCLTLERKYVESEKILLESYNLALEKIGDDAKETQSAAGYLVDLYNEWGKKEKAAKLSEKHLKPTQN